MEREQDGLKQKGKEVKVKRKGKRKDKKKDEAEEEKERKREKRGTTKIKRER